MLVRGDTVPHFEVRTLQGELFSYSSIWQRKNLLLVTLPALDAVSTEGYVSELSACLQHLSDQDLEYVLTRDFIPGISGSSVLVADRWGEIVYTVEESDVAASQDVLEWVNYLNNRCPECEGEAR